MRSARRWCRVDGGSVSTPAPIKGRGASDNIGSRYDPTQHTPFDDGWGETAPAALRTEVHRDASRSVLTYNRSPDLSFDRSVNPYRGCEHGCIYCYARPSHAYLGLSPGLDFETQLFSKPDAPALLRRALCARGYRCQPIALGMNTDCYQPIERKLGITRALLQVLSDFSHPVCLVTKSSLVERDLDILTQLAQRRLVSVCISITTLDHSIARTLEPRAAAPTRRLRTVQALSDAGIPTTVLVAPIIPILTDPELEQILAACADAGARAANYVLLRLPREVDHLFQQWLEAHFPLKAAHVMKRVQDTRGGDKNTDSRFGHRMRGCGQFASMIAQRFALACKRCDLVRYRADLDHTQFCVPPAQGDQMQLGFE